VGELRSVLESYSSDDVDAAIPRFTFSRRIEDDIPRHRLSLRARAAVIEARQARTVARLPFDPRGLRLISMLASNALAIEMMRGLSCRRASRVPGARPQSPSRPRPVREA
jgi:hypothetical protein